MGYQCIWDGSNSLGESPIWDLVKQCLYWIDIDKAILHCLDFETGKYTGYETEVPLCSIALCHNGDILATTKQCITLLKQPDFTCEELLRLDCNDENIIFNDGKCDANGRFWIGTRDNLQSRPVSKLYQFSALKDLQPAIDNLIVSNGLGWSPDNKRFYLTDTIKKAIYRYPFNLANGTIGHGEPLISISEEGVYPDGLSIDCDENIWVALWGAGKIVCYHKDGHVSELIELPAKNVTSCCFGGREYKTLFITSASIDFAGDKNLGKQAGGVFAIETSVKGLPTHSFKIEI